MVYAGLIGLVANLTFIECEAAFPFSGARTPLDSPISYFHDIMEWPGRADEEEIEDEVRKRSATADAMGAKTLCIPLEQPDLPPGTKCFVSGKPAKKWALWGRSY